MVSTSFALDEYGKLQEGALDEAIDRIRLRSMEKKRDVLTTQLKLSGTLDPDEVQDLLERKVKLDISIKELRSKLLLVKVNSEE